MKINKKYDIIELGPIPPPYGGVTVSVYRLVNKLSADGFQVGGYSIEKTDKEVNNFPRLYLDKGLSTRRFLLRYFYYRRIVRQFKVIHSHWSLHHMIYLWCFMFFLKKKIVITVHDAMIRSFYEKGDDVINKLFLKHVAKSKNVTWIAVSSIVKNELQKLPFDFKGDIHVIPAYIPDTSCKWKPLPAQLQDYIGRHHRCIVFYAHSFMYYEGKDVYGIEEALNLYSRIVKEVDVNAGLVFCLAEDNDMEQIHRLHLLAKNNNIDDKVYWQIGPLESMYPLWEKTDVYVRPTSTDGDAVAVREALDMGVQVVASDVSYRPDRCIKYHFGDDVDLFEKTVVALKEGKKEKDCNFYNYNRIKDIYVKLLQA